MSFYYADELMTGMCRFIRLFNVHIDKIANGINERGDALRTKGKFEKGVEM